MLSNVLPDPFFYFSHHQWGILLSGVIAGLIAVGGVAATLSVQWWIFRKQERSNAEDLSKQLSSQAKEASKQREIAARADLIASLYWLQNARVSAPHEIQAAERSVTAAIYRWRIELRGQGDGHELWDELQHWPTQINASMGGGSTVDTLRRVAQPLIDAAMYIGNGQGSAVPSSAEVAERLRTIRQGS